MQKHGALTAIYFLVHAILGVRETGYWEDVWFVTCKNKSGTCHYFNSEYMWSRCLKS